MASCKFPKIDYTCVADSWRDPYVSRAGAILLTFPFLTSSQRPFFSKCLLARSNSSMVKIGQQATSLALLFLQIAALRNYDDIIFDSRHGFDLFIQSRKGRDATTRQIISSRKLRRIYLDPKKICVHLVVQRIRARNSPSLMTNSNPHLGDLFGGHFIIWDFLFARPHFDESRTFLDPKL